MPLLTTSSFWGPSNVMARYLDPVETPVQFAFGFGLSYSNISLSIDSLNGGSRCDDGGIVLFTNGSSPTLQVNVEVWSLPVLTRVYYVRNIFPPLTPTHGLVYTGC